MGRLLATKLWTSERSTCAADMDILLVVGGAARRLGLYDQELATACALCASSVGRPGLEPGTNGLKASPSPPRFRNANATLSNTAELGRGTLWPFVVLRGGNRWDSHHQSHHRAPHSSYATSCPKCSHDQISLPTRRQTLAASKRTPTHRTAPFAHQGRPLTALMSALARQLVL